MLQNIFGETKIVIAMEWPRKRCCFTITMHQRIQALLLSQVEV